MCFFNSVEQAYLVLNEPFYTLKTMISRNLFSKTNSIHYGSNVPVAAASNIDGFHSRHTRVSLTKLIRPILS
jgi:hypothetical protein